MTTRVAIEREIIRLLQQREADAVALDVEHERRRRELFATYQRQLADLSNQLHAIKDTEPHHETSHLG